MPQFLADRRLENLFSQPPPEVAATQASAGGGEEGGGGALQGELLQATRACVECEQQLGQARDEHAEAARQEAEASTQAAAKR